MLKLEYLFENYELAREALAQLPHAGQAAKAAVEYADGDRKSVV